MLQPNETEDVNQALVRRPFLQRSVEHGYQRSICLHKAPYTRTRRVASEESVSETRADGSLEIRVCVRTYKIFYVSNTEESLHRTRSAEEDEHAAKNLEVHNTRRKAWLKKFTAVKEVPTSAAPTPTPPSKSPTVSKDA